MTSNAKQLREFMEVIEDLGVQPTLPPEHAKPDDVGKHIKTKKSHAIPTTPEGRLREIIVSHIDELFHKLSEMEGNLDPELRQEVEEKLLGIVAFAREKLQ